MSDFVQLWVYLSATPLFGLTATLLVYVLAHAAYFRARQAPWANPVLWSVVVLACGLLATGVSYPTYFAGAQFIHFLLGPAVVALGWPLWLRRAELRQRWGRLLVAALAGGSVAAGVVAAAGLVARPAAGADSCRWCPSRSPRRWPWALPSRSAAFRPWRRCLR